MASASRVVSVLMKVVGGLLALLVLAYLGVNAASLLEAHGQRDEIADQIFEAVE